ncbi:hypothetical protein HMN09_00358000 [Mycena chlorophos]|uniref:Uncharacterized protein n=1 Tax=Mycena chlorophos TaxID=658473 RepID=A0A8H6TIS5_MYCCL|nr:hypothetical protein HMN09_00358000 [Mycena chlorophos]
MSTHGLPGAYSPPRYYSTVPEDEEVPSGQATSAYAPSPGLRRSWGVSTSTAAAASTASLPPVGQGYYLYYRLFTLDGALTVNTTFDPHDPLVGRIKTSSVAPPHYPLSLKRRLGEAEGLLDPQGLRMQLYPLASSLEVFAEGFVVGKLGTDVGATPDTAVALVMIDSRPIRDQAGWRVPTMTQHVGKYIYYTLHMPAGSIHSSCAFDPSEAYRTSTKCPITQALHRPHRREACMRILGCVS